MQSGGVTAGYVGAVTIAPPLVRGPLLERFKATFAEGAKLLRTLQTGMSTDDVAQQTIASVNVWTQTTYGWLHDALGDYAAERFAFRPGTLISWTSSAPLKPETQKAMSDATNSMTTLLQNLDVLMRDPSIYPQK